LRSRERQRWKEWIKPWVLRGVFSFVDVIMAASNAARTLAIGCGIAEERIRVIRAGADKEAYAAEIWESLKYAAEKKIAASNFSITEGDGLAYSYSIYLPMTWFPSGPTA
jgi:hypothetical protein